MCWILEEYRSVYRGGFLAACSLQPLLQPWRTWGAKETQSLHIGATHQHPRLAGEREQDAGSREGAGCGQREQELEQCPKRNNEGRKSV